MNKDIALYTSMIEDVFRETGEIDVFIKPGRQIGGQLKYVHSYSCTIWPEEEIIAINENFENGFIQAPEIKQYSEELRKAGFKLPGENPQENDLFYEGQLSLATLEFALYFLKTRNVKVIPADKNRAKCCNCGIYQPINEMKKTEQGYDCGCDRIFKGRE